MAYQRKNLVLLRYAKNPKQLFEVEVVPVDDPANATHDFQLNLREGKWSCRVLVSSVAKRKVTKAIGQAFLRGSLCSYGAYRPIGVYSLKNREHLKALARAQTQAQFLRGPVEKQPA